MMQAKNEVVGTHHLRWASDADQSLWEPRLTGVSRACAEVMWRSVTVGLRRCCTVLIRANELAARATQWAEYGLSATYLSIESGDNGYANVSTKPRLGKPVAFHVGLALPGDLAEFKYAWNTHDDEEIGRLLGYPACCRDFFRRVWVESGLVDTIWPMAAENALQTDAGIEVTGRSECNVLWRWLGARAVPHLPCRFDCCPTSNMGDRFVRLGRKMGYVEEMNWLVQMLAWPVEWEADRGIAAIKTPVVTMLVRTDATPQKLVVRWKEDLGRSLTSKSAVFPPPVEHAMQTQIRRPSWYHTDNSFSTLQTMERLHKPLLSLVRRALARCRGNVLDLGCGNGALLQKICEENEALIPFGIEIVRERLAHASELLPHFHKNFVVGDFFDLGLWDSRKHYALAILMIGRLLEVSQERADNLLAGLTRCCDQVLVYVYPDSSEGLKALVERAGLHLREESSETTGLLDMGHMIDEKRQ